jgi:ABC-type transporter Mla subunit MlaD
MRLALAPKAAVAEVDKVVAEVDKVAAEVDKVAAEVDKVAAEVNEVVAEVDKVAAEVNKAVAEVDKVAAEMNKAVAEVDKVAAEVNEDVAEVKRNYPGGSEEQVYDKVDRLSDIYVNERFNHTILCRKRILNIGKLALRLWKKKTCNFLKISSQRG